jgi:hypothetical protein
MKKTTNKTTADLAETKDDKKHLQPDKGILNLPDVKDIPGQEHVRVPKLGEFADTTISSDDEEGVRVFGKDEDSDETIITDDEKKALREAAEKTPGAEDEDNLERAQLDDRDEDGELLNERTNNSGSDLDIPGSEDDDENEELGEEDEENNSYSLDSEKEDDSISKQ